MDVKEFVANYMPVELTESRILIVDDDPTILKVFTRLLQQAGFENVKTTPDPRQARHLYITFQPDAVILDLHMPELDGIEVMQQFNAFELDDYVPVLVLTSESDLDMKIKALTSGARDFMIKPFVPVEALARVRNILEVSRLRRRIQIENQKLEEELSTRTRELEEAQWEAQHLLSQVSRYRGDAGGQHALRMRRYLEELAPACGISEELCRLLSQAAAVYDLGMIGIPDQILLKKGTLSAKERKVVQGHVEIGAQMLSGVKCPILKVAEEVVRTHHERWDGAGYPGRLKGEQIPITGRLVALCDTFDALTSERPHRSARSIDQAVTEIKRCRGSQFDPLLTDLFLASLPQLTAIRNEIR